MLRKYKEETQLGMLIQCTVYFHFECRSTCAILYIIYHYHSALSRAMFAHSVRPLEVLLALQ